MGAAAGIVLRENVSEGCRHVLGLFHDNNVIAFVRGLIDGLPSRSIVRRTQFLLLDDTRAKYGE